jgi:hypothetical protein
MVSLGLRSRAVVDGRGNMMNRRWLYAAVVFALAACSTSKRAATTAVESATAGTPTTSSAFARAPAATSQAAPTSAPPSPIASSTPLSVYAAQYEALIKPANDAFAAVRALPSNTTDAAITAALAKTAPVIEAADAALLRVPWPPNVATDIRALVTADGPLLADLANLSPSTIDEALRESGVANAAANIVRADLGLPPVK